MHITCDIITKTCLQKGIDIIMIKFRKIICFIVSTMMLSTVAGCQSSETNDKTLSSQPEITTENVISTTVTEPQIIDLKNSVTDTFEILSDDLHDGVWDTIITNTAKGSNASPHLKWEAVPEAEFYAVYMVDTSAGNWLHWKSENICKTELLQGDIDKKEYVGPYPPSGTHTYEVYVIALRQQPTEETKLAFDSSNSLFFEKVMALDKKEDGDGGNIISYACISGTYTRGD